MKKLTAVLLALALLALFCGALAAGKEVKLKEGKYIIGRDIPAGRYRLTCTGTTGQQFSNVYGALGNAFDAMEGTNTYGNLFGAFGGLMEEYSELSVEIVGDYGDVLASKTLKDGDYVYINLKEGTALRITDGTCTLAKSD